jgi:hypothetical protein
MHQKMLNFSREVQNRNKLILSSSGQQNLFIEDDEVRYKGKLVSEEQAKKTELQIRKLKEKLFAY